jgi:hypothetical protein
MVGIVIAVIIAALVLGFVFFFSPGPPAYTLTPTDLTIRDRFYPVTVKAGTVDIQRVRDVDFAVAKDSKPAVGTNGFG